MPQFDCTANALGQRYSAKQSGSAFADYGDATFYRYSYNSRGELTLAAGYLGSSVASYSSSNAMPGRYFELGYDQAGNRNSYNATGVSGLAAAYAPNNLNQIHTRENLYVPVSGTVDSPAKVVVSGSLAGQQGNYWSGEGLLDNTGGAVYHSIDVKAANSIAQTQETTSVTAYLAPITETFGYDDDGNLTSDGRWTYAYDAENRLVQMETNRLSSVPNVWLATRLQMGQPASERLFVRRWLMREAGHGMPPTSCQESRPDVLFCA